MALEKSVLTDIPGLILEHYGISADAVKKMPLGTANCYCITSGTKKYFLKEFQSSYNRDAIEQEARLTEYLTQNGIPAAKIYPSANGDICFEHAGHAVCLEEYVEGISYGYDELPEHLLNNVAAMLGKLHTVMKPLPLPRGMGTKWVGSFSADALINQYRTLEESAKSRPYDPNSARIILDMRYKSELAARCSEYIQYHDGITYSPTHGDYQACQLIWNGDEIAAVIDFSAAAELPVVWEIMRSFVQSSSSCRKTAVIDVDALVNYVHAYMEYAPLTRADLEAMPYVYLFQLARSKYGYGQYLNSDSEDRIGLLNFAFWRTDMCREMETKAHIISEMLAGLL